MLKGKRIVIIGGTTGLGLSAAIAFVREGAKVVIVGRDPDSGEKAKITLGEAAAVYTGDATDATTAVNAIELCIQAFGGFDGLYHVAGGSGRKVAK